MPWPLLSRVASLVVIAIDVRVCVAGVLETLLGAFASECPPDAHAPGNAGSAPCYT